MKNLQINTSPIGAQEYPLTEKVSEDIYIYGEKIEIPISQFSFPTQSGNTGQRKLFIDDTPIDSINFEGMAAGFKWVDIANYYRNEYGLNTFFNYSLGTAFMLNGIYDLGNITKDGTRFVFNPGKDYGNLKVSWDNNEELNPVEISSINHTKSQQTYIIYTLRMRLSLKL